MENKPTGPSSDEPISVDAARTGSNSPTPSAAAGGAELPSEEIDSALDDSGPNDTKLDRPPRGPASAKSKTRVTTLGDFRLIRKLGEGGMGTVYLAQQSGLERPVAIKVLAKHLAADPRFVQRFQREAKVMAKLDHPNILRCFAADEAFGYHYLAMEYADAGSVESWVNRLGKMSVADSLFIVIAAAQGLQHAHDQDLIHRDIKPDNILVTSKGAIKLADLGLAKAMSENLTLTRSGTGVGTPVYMSPEQARDAKHVDGRSDIYALGCVLYRCVTGRPPYTGETFIELFESKMKGKFSPARKFNDEVPPRLDVIIDRALAVDPKHRYQTCAELIQDLQELGLAAESLSFIAHATPASGVIRSSGVRKAPALATTAVAAPAPPPTPPREVEPEIWFVKALNFQGIRKMTRKQVLDYIQDSSYDLKAEARRGSQGEFRPIASFGEFESTVRGRIAKIAVDRKSSSYKSKFEQILEEEKAYREQREFEKVLRRFGAWIGPLLALAAVSGIGYLIYWLVKKFILTGS